MRFVALPTLIGSLLTISSASAAPPEISAAAGSANVARLVWRRAPAAASCPGGVALERAVEQRVGRPVFAPAGGASLPGASLLLLIDGYAERDAARGVWRATLELSSADGTSLGRRELSNAAPGCGPLSEMVVLVVALMIRDRDLLSAPQMRAPVPSPLAAEPPAPLATTTPSRQAFRTWEATSDVAGTLSTGLFPNPAIGLRLRGVVRPPRAPAFVLEAAVALPGEARFGAAAGGRFFGAWLGGAVCPVDRSTQPWRLRICAGGAAGVLFFGPFGTDATGQQRRPLVVGRVGAGLERDLGRAWFAVVDAELLVPLIRERFEIHDEHGPHTLFQMTRVGVIGGFGVGRRF